MIDIFQILNERIENGEQELCVDKNIADLIDIESIKQKNYDLQIGLDEKSRLTTFYRNIPIRIKK